MKLFLIENEIPVEEINGWITLIAHISPSLEVDEKKILSEVWLECNDDDEKEKDCDGEKMDVLIGQLKVNNDH